MAAASLSRFAAKLRPDPVVGNLDSGNNIREKKCIIEAQEARTIALGNLNEMGTFIAVASHESFAAAARALGLSPSAVSKQIRVLEERLGVRLIHRTTRRVTLTEPGRLYLDRARSVLEEVEQLESAVRGLQAEPRGTLRVSTPQDFGRLCLCDAIGAFAAGYPELRIELDLTDRMVDLIEEGFDVAVRISRPRDSSLVQKRLGHCRRMLCATPRYLERHGRPDSPSALGSHSCVEYGYLAEEGWRFRVDGRRQTVIPSGRLRANSGWAMRSMALADLGIALLPAFLVHDDLASGRLVSLLGDQLDADVELAALLPPGRQVPAKTRAFLDFLVGRLATEPWWQSAPIGSR